ncbi:MAG: GNAT family N-acetyltransferase [[Clostridium] leptum]
MVFFAIHPAYRSLGIGKELYSRFLNYMKNESIEHCYVYTDTTCNYGFYERQNMLQCGTEKITLQLNASPKNFLFFIYDN